MTIPGTPEDQEGTRMLFAYLNGEMGEAERARFEARLQSDHRLANELADWQALRGELRTRGAQRAEEAGLAEFTRRMRLARPPVRETAGWLARASAWLGQFATPPRFAMAAALVLVQAGVIAVMLGHGRPADEVTENNGTLVRSVQGDGASGLRVRFKPEATARELAVTLSSVGARITDGPGQGGFYVIEVPAQTRAAAIASLRQSKAVDELIEPAAPTR